MAKGVTVDASVALSWVLPGEEVSMTMTLRDRATQELDLTLSVPPTFWYEVSNALWVSVRRGRLKHGDAAVALEALMDFRFETWVPDPLGCLSLALKHSISVYDSAYLQVAMESESSLWTVDRLLVKAAEGAGVRVEPAV